MRTHWFGTFAVLTLVGLLADDAAAQRYDRDTQRGSRQQTRELDDVEDDEEDREDDDRREMEDDDDAGDRDDDHYTTQYGSDDSRTSRDYSLDRNNEYATERSDRGDRQRARVRPDRSSGAPRGEDDFDRDNNDAPHSSTRTDRRNRFDEEISRFEDDEFSSRSFQPPADRSADRMEQSEHDYSQGLWSRALSASERSSSRRGQDRTADSDGGQDQTWAEWWSDRVPGDDETHGEASERFVTGVDEFLRQHDEDEDNYLSRREMPRGMLENFHDLDADGDDYLSRSELQQHGRTMQSVAHGGFEPRAQAVIRVPMEVTYLWIMDTDRGQVRMHDLQEAYDLLQRIDANNDGNITRSELRDRRQHVVARWIEHGFNRLDENEDDAISRSEAEQSMLQERFDRLDSNRDGELTRGELRRSAEHASAKWGPQDEDAYLSEGQDDDSRR